MESYIAQTVEAYNQHPERFEQATAGRIPAGEITHFIDLMPRPDLPVLDVGCAFGRDCVEFAGRGLNAIGIDLSRQFLARAVEFSGQIENPPAYAQMDARQLALADQSVGGVWCHATLLHLKDPDIMTALSEFNRVLASNAPLFVSFKEGLGQERVLDSFSSGAPRFFNYQNQGGVARLLDRAGFRVTENYLLNELTTWGPGNRDINWLYCFAIKA